MYGTVIPHYDTGDLSLATHNGIIVVGTRDDMDAIPGTTVLLPDTITPTIPITDCHTAIPGTPWDVTPVDLTAAGQ